jgi:hypothetical protein
MARCRAVKWLVVLLAACGAASHGRIGYVITAKDDTPSGRAALAHAIGAGDDTSGDGFVIRLDDAGRARVAAMPAVAAVAPLAAAAKHGALPATGEVHARIDLYEDASAAEADAVAAWIGAHGGAIAARGATWIDATLAASALGEIAELASVRWVEGH